jgi:hypothetical protein
LGNIYRLEGKYLPIRREMHDEITHRLLAVSQWCRPNPDFLWSFVGATELHAAFREESRTSLLSTSAALKGNPGKRQASSWFSSKENHTRDLYHATVIAKLPY